MIRLRPWFPLALLVFVPPLLVTPPGRAPAAGDQKAPDAPEKKWLVDRAVTVSPAAAPVPALKYRLFPKITDRKEGNAVPLYLRFAHERGDARKKELNEKPGQWNALPLDKLPRKEVRKFLAGHRYNLRQLDLGARRSRAEWNYTLDAGDPIGLLLPDMQEMRMHARLLVLQARLQTAEGRYAEAVRTLETGFSFSQQVSEAPFLISSLVGIAAASQFADGVLELSERPGAPNLYWALAVLPRPLVDLRRGNEFEEAMLEMQFPDLADLDRPRPAAEWDGVLRRIRTELARITKLDRGAFDPKSVPAGRSPADPAGKSPDLPAAREYLTQVASTPAAKVKAMPDAEILVRYLSGYYHELRDEMFKSTYLPFPEAQRLSSLAAKRLKSAPNTEAADVARLFLPAIAKVQLAAVRIERRLALLRAVEALRMHAAAQGAFPDKLAQVTVVPVPNDPGTGKPFEYRRQGESATLTSRIPGEPLNTTGLRYRLTLRK